ncbi:lipopolysaccharide transport periplasmic protein LptA [Desulfogranum mediterraneum]|uniref:lipopolysaccharide transport periplasmic protein LptA n=1 Tax=Desulfogranum mediterraneum TaxID=160661 RepID=UPI0003F84D6E|nr:lipopolysaccharide transport periplasmic protein LptA [Desulfogranum mediterraneum]
MESTIRRLADKLTILAFAALISLGGATAQAADDAPIHIEADRMISQEAENSVVFLGNVDAKQGDVTIRSEEMTVYYSQKTDKSGKKSSNQVKKLICKKNVEVVQEDWVGTGNRMDYFAGDRKVILSGNAKAWQGQNMVSGKTITYYLDEKRSIVEQDPAKSGRVKAVLHPDADKKK